MAAFSTKEFEGHFKELYRPLCLFALRFTGCPDDAEDIVQQTFADMWDKRPAMEKVSNMKAYLFRAVKNRSLTFAEKNENNVSTDEFPEVEDVSIDEQIYTAERDARLWNAIDKLPRERKKIFLLSKRDGLKYREIADQLHISVKTVENQMGKALKALRDTAVRIYMFFFG